MASFSVKPEYTPFTWQEMTAPYTALKEENKRQSDEYSKILENMKDLDDLKDSTVDAETYQKYTDFKNRINEMADTIAENGVNVDTLRNLTKYRNEYINDYENLVEKIKLRGELTKEQRLYMKEHPNAFFDKDYSVVPVTDVTENSTYESYDMDNEAKNVASDIYNLYMGATEDKPVTAAELAAVINSVRDKYGYTSLSDRQRKLVDNAITSGMMAGEQTYTQARQKLEAAEYDRQLKAWKIKNEAKKFYAPAKSGNGKKSGGSSSGAVITPGGVIMGGRAESAEAEDNENSGADALGNVSTLGKDWDPDDTIQGTVKVGGNSKATMMPLEYTNERIKITPIVDNSGNVESYNYVGYNDKGERKTTYNIPAVIFTMSGEQLAELKENNPTAYEAVLEAKKTFDKNVYGGYPSNTTYRFGKKMRFILDDNNKIVGVISRSGKVTKVESDKKSVLYKAYLDGYDGKDNIVLNALKLTEKNWRTTTNGGSDGNGPSLDGQNPRSTQFYLDTGEKPTESTEDTGAQNEAIYNKYKAPRWQLAFGSKNNSAEELAKMISGEGRYGKDANDNITDYYLGPDLRTCLRKFLSDATGKKDYNNNKDVITDLKKLFDAGFVITISKVNKSERKTNSIYRFEILQDSYEERVTVADNIPKSNHSDTEEFSDDAGFDDEPVSKTGGENTQTGGNNGSVGGDNGGSNKQTENKSGGTNNNGGQSGQQQNLINKETYSNNEF